MKITNKERPESHHAAQALFALDVRISKRVQEPGH